MICRHHIPQDIENLDHQAEIGLALARCRAVYLEPRHVERLLDGVPSRLMDEIQLDDLGPLWPDAPRWCVRIHERVHRHRADEARRAIVGQLRHDLSSDGLGRAYLEGRRVVAISGVPDYGLIDWTLDHASRAAALWNLQVTLGRDAEDFPVVTLGRLPAEGDAR